MSLPALPCYLFRNKTCDGSSATSHVYDSEWDINRARGKVGKCLPDKCPVDLRVKWVCCECLECKWVGFFCLNHFHRSSLLGYKVCWCFRENLDQKCFM